MTNFKASTEELVSAAILVLAAVGPAHATNDPAKKADLVAALRTLRSSVDRYIARAETLGGVSSQLAEEVTDVEGYEEALAERGLDS